MTSSTASSPDTGLAVPDAPAARRRPSLGVLAFAGSACAGLLISVIVSTILILHARNAVREETDSALQIASAAATLRLPTAFMREDMLARAVAMAADLDDLRHVSAWVADADGKIIGRAPRSDDARPFAPRLLTRLLTPEPKSEIFPIRQYPNVVGLLHVETDPSDEIAKTWQNLRVILPLLAAAMAVMMAVSVAVALIVQRRLRMIGRTLDRMRGRDLSRQAPDSALAELAALSDGVNTLAAHLRDERAENLRLQARIVTLTESERARIASDLHDDMGPQLFALRAAVGQARNATRHPEPDAADIDEALDAITRHAREIQKSARNAIESLRPVCMGGETLDDMLRELVLSFAEIAPDVAIRLDADPQAGIDEAVEISVYRFVRESVLNAIRHGAPAEIGIVLRAGPDGLLARVTDDGKGPATRTQGARGLGLAGIEDRAAAIGAIYTAPRRDGERTLTELWIPT